MYAKAQKINNKIIKFCYKVDYMMYKIGKVIF